jgi:hypothetical protein
MGENIPYNIYTSEADLMPPQKALHVGPDKIVTLLPLNTSKKNNAYIRMNGKNYCVMQNNNVPTPAQWSSVSVPFGNLYDIAAGNGIFMFVGYKFYNTNPNPWQYCCFISTDGTNWTQKENPFPAEENGSMPILAYHHNNFYCTNKRKLVYSPDGNGWQEFLPYGIESGRVWNMAVNYWNDKYAYYIGESRFDSKKLELIGEDKNISSAAGNEIYDKGGQYYVSTAIVFWGKHLYIPGSYLLSASQKNYLLLHLDATSNGRQPVFKGNLIPTFLTSGVYFIPYGNKLYVVYDNGTKSSVDGHLFSDDTLPFSTPVWDKITNVILTKGDDLPKKLAIISAENKWFAFDHKEGTVPIEIINSSGIQAVKNVVFTNNKYLALEHNGLASVSGRLWVADSLWSP